MTFRRSYHLFVCDNRRPAAGRPSCGAAGGRALVEALRVAVLADLTLCAQVAVTACDCLGPCFDGPNMVVYPEGVWYGGVTAEDVDEIVEQHLRRGTPVARLRLDPETDDDP